MTPLDHDPVLAIIDGDLEVVEVPGGVVLDDAAMEHLHDVKTDLRAVVEVFGAGIRVVQALGKGTWPPRGGWLPSAHVATRELELATQPARTPNDGWRDVCPTCGAKGRACRQPRHDIELRRCGEQLLKRTRSAKRRAQIEAAIAHLPLVPPKPKASRRAEKVQRWRAPKIRTTRFP